MSSKFPSWVSAQFAADFNRLLEPEIPVIRERAERAIAMLLAANAGMARDEAIKIYAAMIGNSVCHELACRAPYMLGAAP